MATKIELPVADIGLVGFYILDEESIATESVCEVKNSEIFHDKLPQQDGIYDTKMGTMDYGFRCGTCQKNKPDCPGHQGMIKLNYPVLNPTFIKHVLRLLKAICHNCGYVISYDPKNPKHVGQSFKFFADEATAQKDKLKCSQCGKSNPNIKYDKTKRTIVISVQKTDVNGNKSETVSVFHAHEILAILKRIRPSAMSILGMENFKPTALVMVNFVIPATSIRPELRKIKSSRVNNNEINIHLQGIIQVNNKINWSPGTPISSQTRSLINDLNNNISAYMSAKSAKKTAYTKKAKIGITDTWSQKYGRVRRNLMGKRSNNSGRSFITCDISMEVDELGIPIVVAKKIHIPETVTLQNIERLRTYVINGPNQYPGAHMITHKSGETTYVNTASGTIPTLNLGDIVLRDVITGDNCIFNRQPSLEPSSITAMRVKVIPESKRYSNLKTYRMNVITCNLFGADFDGDAMNIGFPNSVLASTEISEMASPAKNFVTAKNAKPKLGQVLDSVVGCADLTREKTRYSKLHAMQLFSRTKTYPRFTKETYSGKELMSMLFTENDYRINYTTKPQFYDNVTAINCRYDPNDTNLVIENGTIKSGILDNASIGADVRGGVFHIIHNKYGPKKAMESVYRVQQIAINNIKFHGLTVALNDLTLKRESLQAIYEIEQSLIRESQRITENLNNGNIVPPLGKSIAEHYETLQLKALDLNAHNQTFNKIIMESINFEQNGLYTMVRYGAKGKFANLRSISSAVGQITINGERIAEKLEKRTAATFQRYDTRPEARGFIANNYYVGLDMSGFYSHANESRYQLINTALSTSVTGEYNRRSIKNLEGIITNNHRQTVYNGRILQPLYGFTGVDPRYVETVVLKLGDLKYTDPNAFAKSYSLDSVLDKKLLSNSALSKQIKAEFELLSQISQEAIANFKQLETIKNLPYNNTIMVICNIKNIIDNSNYNTETVTQSQLASEISEIASTIDEAYKAMNKLLFNSNWRGLMNTAYINLAMFNLRAHFKDWMNLRYILEKQISLKYVREICGQFYRAVSNCLIGYGKPIGVIAAQSISEPMTQMVLDSRHYSGVGGSKKKGMKRANEITNAREENDSPTMNIYIRKPWCYDKNKVQEIANNIEMMQVGAYMGTQQIFFEGFAEPQHPLYRHEKEWIEQYLRFNRIKRPNNVTNWCVRIVFDKIKLFEKNLSIEEIYAKLQSTYPETLMVHTVDNDNIVVLRIYILNNYNRGVINTAILEGFIRDLRNQSVRGVRGIVATYIREINRTNWDPKTRDETPYHTEYYIISDGSNLYDIVENPYVDPDTIQSDNIHETKNFLGIRAGRNKIVSELAEQVGGINYAHYTIYADAMTSSGDIHAINRFGNARRGASALLRISDSSPLTNIKESAFNQIVDSTEGLSQSLMTGKVPRFSGLYNQVALDEEFIRRANKATIDEINDL